MIFQGEEDDGINIVLIAGALFIVLVVGALVFGAYRLYQRSVARKQPSRK